MDNDEKVDESAKQSIPRASLNAGGARHRFSIHSAVVTAAAHVSTVRHHFERDDLLHGHLRIKIIECRHLRNKDRFKPTVRALLGQDVSDPFVTVWLKDTRICKTRVISDNLNPRFDSEFYRPVAHEVEHIKFQVLDKDSYGSDDLGKYYLPVKELLYPGYDGRDSLTKIMRKQRRECGTKRIGVHKTVFLDGKKRHGSLEFFVEFIPQQMMVRTKEVPGVYFKETKGNDVNLYVNADDDGSSSKIVYDDDTGQETVWKPPRLWRDIYDSMCSAKHFIYVAGWSIDTHQYLLRGHELEEALKNSKYSPRIGELLKQKAAEGLTVNVMQWDDASSNFLLPGMMGTHDEATRRFFADSEVNALICSTEGGDVNTAWEKIGKKVLFTHHQKMIMMDIPIENSDERELHAFVGGIDLTNGRWDNREHSLFRTLQSLHKGDVYSKCFNFVRKPDLLGPRQPWHDIHSSVRGSEALNIIQVFSERWIKQAPPHLTSAIVNLQDINFKVGEVADKPGGWCTQTFRSIDARVNTFEKAAIQSFRYETVDDIRDVRWISNDVNKHLGLREKMKQKMTGFHTLDISRRFESNDMDGFIFNRTLGLKKGRFVDESIHLANVHHIRRAKHFIYIESQYFMGSSHTWSSHKDRKVKCGNLIPAEICYKICKKIDAGEKFAVYIVLPMWPEGIPGSAPIQEILYWQRVTIEAMYCRIEKALQQRMETSSDFSLNASDYLNFYCLGNRETVDGNESESKPVAPDGALLSLTRRHQIYVHSKMMIVDDEVALIGTANINQRSMDGHRDTEVMISAYQPEHTAGPSKIAHGKVHAFRMHIWATITGRMDDSFREPSSPECVLKMNEIAMHNWDLYLQEEPVEMKSHLLPSPFEWSVSMKSHRSLNSGPKLRARRGLLNGNFPDTKGHVLGKKSFLIPDLITT